MQFCQNNGLNLVSTQSLKKSSQRKATRGYGECWESIGGPARLPQRTTRRDLEDALTPGPKVPPLNTYVGKLTTHTRNLTVARLDGANSLTIYTSIKVSKM